MFVHLGKERIFLIILFSVALVFLGGFCLLRDGIVFADKPRGTYETLKPDTDTGDPLRFFNADFSIKGDFETNLPIVVLTLDSELPDYKLFKNLSEIVYDVEPYTTGFVQIMAGSSGVNRLSDAPVYESLMKIKRKGHSSYAYDKKQYKLKCLLQDGADNKADILGMGQGSEWILNGSMADKSMLRNYLAYRIASEIDGNNMAPDSRFCEVLFKEGEKYFYQGVYLLMETVSPGKDRINIEKYDEKNDYSSYIVRRDRLTSFDIMLDTYGRKQGIALGSENPEKDNWIGLKYPSASKVTPETIDYITDDFSWVERVLYTDDNDLFYTYGRYIDVNSFVDYFLINEFFGNYDAGEHSTYMYKNYGRPLSIGPVWDYDQAMDNAQFEETNAEDLAFQTQTFFEELCRDRQFVNKLRSRYAALRRNRLSEEHVFQVMEEAKAYLKSAQVREWYRWAEDYLEDPGGEALGKYYLYPYQIGDETLNRFTDRYEQEIIVMKEFIHKHGQAIAEDLMRLGMGAKLDSKGEGVRGFLLFAAMSVLLISSYLIAKRG